MNIENPIVKFALFGNANLACRISETGKIDLCSLASAIGMNLILLIACLGFGFWLVLFPAGLIIGELAGAISTGYWTMESAYGAGVYVVGGIMAISFVLFAMVSAIMFTATVKNYKGNNAGILLIKSIKEKACYQIEIKGVK